jgi:hypothetical protein
MGWPGRAQRLICWTCREAKLKEHAMRTSHQNTPETISMVAPRGWLHLIPQHQLKKEPEYFNTDSFPAEVCEME